MIDITDTAQLLIQLTMQTDEDASAEDIGNHVAGRLFDNDPPSDWLKGHVANIIAMLVQATNEATDLMGEALEAAVDEATERVISDIRGFIAGNLTTSDN